MINDSMELKRQLLETSLEYKEEIREAFQAVMSRLGKTGVNALLISGSLAMSYLLYRAMATPVKTIKRKKNNIAENEAQVVDVYQPPTMIDKLADKILEQALLFLLSLAKQKLIEYLNDQSKKNDNTSESEGQVQGRS